MKLTLFALALIGLISLAVSCPVVVQQEITSWPYNGDTAHQLKLTFDDTGCENNGYSNFIIKVDPANLQVIQSWNLGQDLGGGEFLLPDWTTTANFDGGYTYLGANPPTWSLVSHDGVPTTSTPGPIFCAGCPGLKVKNGPNLVQVGPTEFEWNMDIEFDAADCEPNDFENFVISIGPNPGLVMTISWNLGTDNGDGTWTLPNWVRTNNGWSGGFRWTTDGAMPELCVQSYTGSVGCPRIVANEQASWPSNGQTAHQIALSINADDCPGTYCDFVMSISPNNLVSIGSWNLGSAQGGGVYNLPSWARVNSFNGGYTYLGNTVPSFNLDSYSTTCPW